MHFNEITLRREFEIGTTDRSQLDLWPTDWAAARTANSPTTDGAVGLISNLSNRVVDLDAAATEAFFPFP